MCSPAHHTKHQPLLHYPTQRAHLLLAQSDDGLSNGTALWLGAQCLSVYLATVSRPSSAKLIELGSGIGLTALVMSSLGWDVLATDTPHVISTVLAPNIQSNVPRLPPDSGTVHVRELDWTVPPDQWTWSDDMKPPFDLVCSADTVYTPALAGPLLRTFHALCTASRAISPNARSPPVYLCIERRDPVLIDRVLADAHDTWGFTVERIPHRKLAKAMDKGGIKWPREEWDGVEIWKLTLPIVKRAITSITQQVGY